MIPPPHPTDALCSCESTNDCAGVGADDRDDRIRGEQDASFARRDTARADDDDTLAGEIEEKWVTHQQRNWRRGRRDCRPRRSFIGRAVSQILFSIAIYLCDLYPRFSPWIAPRHRRGPRLTAYLVLLPMGFSVPPTLLSTRWALTPPFHPYPPRKLNEAGGLFSVALSVDRTLCPAALACERHRALWSLDFPPPRNKFRAAAIRPSKTDVSQITKRPAAPPQDHSDCQYKMRPQ